MSSYLQSLISAGEPRDTPAAPDTHAFDQHITVEAPAPGGPILSASMRPQPAPGAEAIAPQPEQGTSQTAPPPRPAASPSLRMTPDGVKTEQAARSVRNASQQAAPALLPREQSKAGGTEDLAKVVTYARLAAGREPERRRASVQAHHPAGARVNLPGALMHGADTSSATAAPATDMDASEDASEARSPRAEQPVEVHIGSIVLRVKPPPAAPPLAAPAVPAAPQAPRQEARHGDRRRFSPSRHYLRWT